MTGMPSLRCVPSSPRSGDRPAAPCGYLPAARLTFPTAARHQNRQQVQDFPDPRLPAPLPSALPPHAPRRRPAGRLCRRAEHPDLRSCGPVALSGEIHAYRGGSRMSRPVAHHICKRNSLAPRSLTAPRSDQLRRWSWPVSASRADRQLPRGAGTSQAIESARMTVPGTSSESCWKQLSATGRM